MIIQLCREQNGNILITSIVTIHIVVIYQIFNMFKDESNPMLISSNQFDKEMLKFPLKYRYHRHFDIVQSTGVNMYYGFHTYNIHTN